WRASVHHGIEECRHRPDEALDLVLGEAVAEVPHSLRVRLHPQRAVRVTHHLGHIRITEGGKRRGAQLATEFRVQPLLLLGMRRSHASAPTSKLSLAPESPFVV